MKVSGHIVLSGIVPLLFAGCVAIDGGAVEARWVLRNPAGISIQCDDSGARIDSVRFALDPQETGPDPCAAEAYCLFDCRRGVGTTPFRIPEGSYAMSLRMVDFEGNLLDAGDGVRTPPPIVRTVRFGELTNLDVNLIIVDR